MISDEELPNQVEKFDAEWYPMMLRIIARDNPDVFRQMLGTMVDEYFLKTRK